MRIDKERLYYLLTLIPQGRVTTYGRLAEMLGDKNLARSVGNLLNKNPDGDLYPCYRVVNSQGRLSRAYAFGGIEAQKRRLEADGITVADYKVDLKKYGMER